MLEVQLTIIQRDIKEISVSINSQDDTFRATRDLIADLDTRLAQQEIKVTYLDRMIDVYMCRCH